MCSPFPCTHAGDTYDGELRAGRRHGFGRYTFANGGFYEGTMTAVALMPRDHLSPHLCCCFKATGRTTDGLSAASPRSTMARGSPPQRLRRCRLVASPPRGCRPFLFCSYAGEWFGDVPHGKGRAVDARGGVYARMWPWQRSLRRICRNALRTHTCMNSPLQPSTPPSPRRQGRADGERTEEVLHLRPEPLGDACDGWFLLPQLRRTVLPGRAARIGHAPRWPTPLRRVKHSHLM